MKTPSRKRSLLLGAGLALGLAGPARADKPPVPATTAPLTAGGAQALLAAADNITHQVAGLRGLPLLKKFGSGVLNRDQIGRKLQERIEKEYTHDEIAIESRVLKRLGLLAPDADYAKMLNDLLMDQVAGFYDPDAKQLYIADWIDDDMQRPAMAHEIEHALQDQHFDLKKFSGQLKDDGDRQLARSAVVEGDGTAVMLAFVVQAMGVDLGQLPDAFAAMSEQLASGQMGQTPGMAKAPRFLKDTLTFPYFAGMKFVLKLRKKEEGSKKRNEGPWARVDDAFKNPPDSTEQVLHPEKYLKDKPVPITPAAIAALAPAKELRKDVFGEFELREIFASQIDDGEAERAAAGWGGDRMVAYGAADGPVAVVDLSTWDTEPDAVEAEIAMRKLVARQLNEPEPAADKPAVFDKEGESFSVERHGREVLLILGAPTATRAAAAEEVWKKWKVGGKK